MATKEGRYRLRYENGARTAARWDTLLLGKTLMTDDEAWEKMGRLALRITRAFHEAGFLYPAGRA